VQGFGGWLDRGSLLGRVRVLGMGWMICWVEEAGMCAMGEVGIDGAMKPGNEPKETGVDDITIKIRSVTSR
jgi:hypothetical protein